MNFKTLLLGFAAALAAASGASAADAVVVAEPEPMEYVRVCDTYGTGFFYIPGTETCLRVGGYLRYDIGVGFFGHEDVFDKEDLANGIEDENDTYYKRARAALQIDSRFETELGTLRTYAHINFQYTTNDVGGITDASDAVDIEHAYIELGGFRVGKTDSLFVTMTGFAGGVVNDDLVDYEPDRTHQISYTFTGANGFQAAVALEEGDGGSIDIDGDGITDISNAYTIDSYVPHVVAGASLTQGWGGVSAAVGYDSVWDEWAGKVRLDVNATDRITAFILAGYSSTDTGSYYATWNGDWAVWGGASMEVTEKATVNVQLSYDESEDFAAVANVAYQLVPGLRVTPEVAYFDNLGDDNDEDDGDEIGGFLRIQRSF
jgi:opacity protein-like surface antigen